jgi:hypothetical protein
MVTLETAEISQKGPMAEWLRRGLQIRFRALKTATVCTFRHV